MSEENKAVAPETQQTETQPETKPEAQVETPKQNTFTQEQLDNIIKSRLEAEQRKYEKKIQEEEKQKADILKQRELEEAKTKADLEKIMQDRLKEKDDELSRYKTQIKKEKVDNSILSVASQNKAVSPAQVVALLKDNQRDMKDYHKKTFVLKPLDQMSQGTMWVI